MSGARWFGLIGILVAGLLVAVHVAHWLLPVRSPLTPVTLPDGWVGLSPAAKRAYFRQDLDIPFAPQQAYVGIAAKDYALYVNGKGIARNAYVINPSSAFQHQGTDRAQSLGQGRVFEMARTPDLQKRANEEWRAIHYIDVGAYLQPGRNSIAIYTQADDVARFALHGQVFGLGQSMAISGASSAWRASPVAMHQNGKPWHAVEFDTTAWARAVSLGAVEKTVYATAPAQIWTTPFVPKGLELITQGEDVLLHTRLPRLARDASPQNAWIRIYSGLPYSLFVDGTWIGNGGGVEKIEAYDLTRFAVTGGAVIAVRLESPGDRSTVAKFAVDGRVGEVPVSTAAGWSRQQGFAPEWTRGEGDWLSLQGAPTSGAARPMVLQLVPGYDLLWVRHFLPVWFGGALAVMLLAAGLQKLPRVGAMPSSPAVTPAYWLLSLSFLIVLVQELLRYRFQESETLLWLLDPQMTWFWLALAPGMLLLGLTAWFLPPAQPPILLRIESALRQIDTRVWLVLIIAVGAMLRFYQLDFENLQADENVSWDAARGVLRTGGPEAVSGVYYTRSPLYHYGLAAWLGVFGDTLFSARAFSTVPGLAVIALVYLLTWRITRRPVLGLVGALLIAIDPWQVNVSRIIRFYQWMQMFGLLSVYCYLRGFIWREGRTYQKAFFVFCAAAVLSQEVFVIFFPALAIAFALFYRHFDWREDRGLWIGFITVMAIAIIDIAIFTIVCLTSHVGVATSSASIMQLHLFNFTGFANTFFAGNNRANIIYSALFFAGLFYWLWRPNRAVSTLYLIVLLTVATATVLVMQIAARYVFGIYPLMIILAILTADGLLSQLRDWLAKNPAPPLFAKRWTQLAALTLIVAALINLELPAVADSYSRTRNLEHQRALEQIALFRQEGDKILSVHPMPAAIIFGGIDYYLMGILSFDEVYQRGPDIVDRWAGGKLISKIDQLRAVLLRHERVWVVLDEPESLKLSQELLDFLHTSCPTEFEFFGGEALLCERNKGSLKYARDRGGAADAW